jgi:hypothetical protein
MLAADQHPLLRLGPRRRGLGQPQLPTYPKPISCFRAAQLIRAWAQQHWQETDAPEIWSSATVIARGWDSSARCQVAWESGPYEWTMTLTNAVYTQQLRLPGVFCEPYSGWLLSLYPDDDYIARYAAAREHVSAYVRRHTR